MAAATELLRESGSSEAECASRTDFHAILLGKKKGAGGKKRPELETLNLVCERADHFEMILPQIKTRLSDCYEKIVLTYFRSFAEELNGMEFVAVDEYDRKIIARKSSIESLFKNLNESQREYDSLKEPFFPNYLSAVDKATALMEQCLTSIDGISEEMKKWAHDDKTYPKKLWDETIAVNAERAKSTETIKKLQRKRNEMELCLIRQENQRNKVTQKQEEVKRQKLKRDNTLGRFRQNLAETKTERDKTLEELESTEKKITGRKSNSPKYFETLCARVDKLKVEVAQTVTVLEQQECEVSKTEKISVELSRNIEELEKEIQAQSSQVGVVCQ